MVDVVEGRVAVRVAVVDVAGRLADAVAEVSRPTGLLVEVAVRDAVVLVAGFFSKVELATLDLRSSVGGVFNGARVEAVPAIDMRLAVLEIPRFSSPELAIDRGFSSAELLTEGRDRWDEVVDEVKGLRVAEVVVGRVGGLLSELVEEVGARVVEAAVLEVAVEEDVGRFAVVELDTGCLDAEVVLVVVLAGDAGAFSLDASGLELLASSPPESIDESTGVAGGAMSTSASASTATGTDSSIDDMSKYLVLLEQVRCKCRLRDKRGRKNHL